MIEQAASRSPSRRTRRVVIPTALVLLLLICGAAVWNGIRGTVEVDGADGEAVVVRIPPGTSAETIAGILHRQGVLASPFWFRVLATAQGAERRLRAGTYRFHGRLNAADVLGLMLTGPPPVDRLVTIPEGLTVRETFRRLAASGLGSVDGFNEAILSVMPLVHGFDPGADDAEGYLFPDTYRFAENWDEGQIVRKMLHRFLETAARTVGRTPGGAGEGFSIREAVTLASLVEKETGVAAERTMVSGVFTNRLRLGMRLQCDPTVIYALQRAGQGSGRLLRSDLDFDSPWNTYQYAGLPPGPICCPGEAALQAACRPADTRCLYFVADGRGGHTFSRTIGEHNRAVARYRAWQRRNR